MKKLTCLTTLAMLSLSQVNGVGTTFTWLPNGGGTLEMGANWSAVGPGPNTYPDAQDDVAIFGNAFTGPLVAIIELSGAMPHEDMGTLHFTTAGGSGTYQIDTVIDDNNFEMNSSTGTAYWIVDADANNVTSLSGPRLFSNLEIDIASGRTFTLNGGAGQIGGPWGIHWTGPGTFIWKAGGNGAAGPSSVQDGLVQFGFPGLGMCGTCIAFTGTSFTISGGTLQHITPLVGTGNNQFLPTLNMTVSGGTWAIGNFSEAITSLAFTSGTFVGGSGTLTLSHAMTPLTMRNTSLTTNLILSDPGGSAAVTFDPTDNGTASIGGTITLGGIGSQKIFNIGSGSADIDMTISAVMSSGSILKSGAGTLELTGANTYVGTTTVSVGTLLIGTGGSVLNGAVTVLAGATVGGTGTIGTGVGGALNNFGTVAPGLSPGTLTINGNYTQSAAASLDLELLSPTSFDKLVVTNAVTLNGTLNVELLSGHTLFGNNTLTVIDNTGGTGVVGTFATENIVGLPPLSTMDVIYNANSVELSLFIPLAPVSPANSVAFSAPVLSSIYKNTLNFMNHLSRIRPHAKQGGGNTAVTHQERLPSKPTASNTSNMLATASTNFMAAADSTPTTLAGIWGRFNNREQDIAATDSDTRRSNVESPTTSLRIQPSTNRSWGVFADAVGSLGRVYSTSTQDPFRYHSVGGLIGFDYVGDRFGIGLSPGYETLHGKALNHQSKFHIDSAEGTAFGTFLPIKGRDFFIDIIGGGARQWYHFERNTPVGKVHGKTHGWQGNIYGDAGYTFTKGNGTFTPFLGLGYVHVHVNSYDEKGSIFQRFNIGEEKLNSLRTSLGTAANYAVNRNNFSFIPEVRFLWQREFMNHNQKVSFASTPLLVASQLQVFGLGRNTFFAGTLLRFLFNHKIELNGSYDYEWNSKFHSHLFLAGLEKRF